MKLCHLAALIGLLLPAVAQAQYTDPRYADPRYNDPRDPDGEYGRAGERPNGPPIRENPVITAVEIEGPLQPPDFQKMFATTDDQTKEYAQVFDSFTVATSEPREAAKHRLEQLGMALGRDTAAVGYYRERLKELSKTLKTAQSEFDDRMKRLLSKDQQKQYREWRKRQEESARTVPLPSSKRRGGGRPSP